MILLVLETLNDLNKWWQSLLRFGPKIGYFPQPTKSWLTVKHDHFQKAKEIV